MLESALSADPMAHCSDGVRPMQHSRRWGQTYVQLVALYGVQVAVVVGPAAAAALQPPNTPVLRGTVAQRRPVPNGWMVRSRLTAHHISQTSRTREGGTGGRRRMCPRGAPRACHVVRGCYAAEAAVGSTYVRHYGAMVRGCAPEGEVHVRVQRHLARPCTQVAEPLWPRRNTRCTAQQW